MDEFPISIGKKRKGRFAGIAVNLILVLLIVLIVAEVFFFFRFKRYYVDGASMYPTLTGAKYTDDNTVLPGGDYVYADTFATPTRGDIVVIEAYKKGSNVKTTIIKRLIAFGGETVELREGQLYIDGVKIDEPYLDERYNSPDLADNTWGPYTVDEGCICVLGDNRNISNDSRGDYGFIPADDVVGVVPKWSLDMRWLITPVCTFFEFTLPSAFSGCGN